MTACHEIEVCVHCHDVSIHPISSIMGLNSMMIVMLIYLDFDYKKTISIYWSKTLFCYHNILYIWRLIILLLSHLSLPPIYWYVVAWEIWKRNIIMGHMQVAWPHSISYTAWYKEKSRVRIYHIINNHDIVSPVCDP